MGLLTMVAVISLNLLPVPDTILSDCADILPLIGGFLPFLLHLVLPHLTFFPWRPALF